MKRRRHKLEVSTFPFLAVLLCAMGSLILVLLAMDRMARRAALSRVQEQADRQAEERSRSLESLQADNDRRRQQAHAAWEAARRALRARLETQLDQIQGQTKTVQTQIHDTDARTQDEMLLLARLRQVLEAELAKFQGTRLTLQKSKPVSGARQAGPVPTTPPDPNEKARQGLKAMAVELVRLEQTLKELQEARRRDSHTFSVIPYKGKHGESRRPIYVECSRDAVIFHPDHLALSPAADPFAIQAETERRIARQRERLIALQADLNLPPYLMLLVRPDGISNFWAFQWLVKDLGIQFGYELVDPDWVLEFPDADESAEQPWMTNRGEVSPGARAAGNGGPRPIPVTRGTPGGGIDPSRNGPGRGTGFAGPGTGPGGPGVPYALVSPLPSGSGEYRSLPSWPRWRNRHLRQRQRQWPGELNGRERWSWRWGQDSPGESLSSGRGWDGRLVAGRQLSQGRFQRSERGRRFR